VGNVYLLDFGNVLVGSTIASRLQIDNDVSSPADLLSGGFDLTGVNDFGFSGWDPFRDLAAGQAFGGLNLTYNAIGSGLVEDSILFTGFSTNASDPTGIQQTRTLLIRANVFEGGGTVPEPGTLALLLLAGVLMFARGRGARVREGCKLG
jgi:hypothetical protein